MFTGIVQVIGAIRQIEPLEAGCRIEVGCSGLDLARVVIGDSIAVDGVCLTVIAQGPDWFRADVSLATLSVTLGWRSGQAVNLERALGLGAALGGHLVTGHVDGVGRVERFEPIGESRELVIEVPGDLPRYVATKGSITVQGVSLTVNQVEGRLFSTNLIPHTQQVTTLGRVRVGDRVNLEVDLLARYAERSRHWDAELASGRMVSL